MEVQHKVNIYTSLFKIYMLMVLKFYRNGEEYNVKYDIITKN